jgi:hypothetical protein
MQLTEKHVLGSEQLVSAVPDTPPEAVQWLVQIEATTDKIHFIT